VVTTQRRKLSACIPSVEDMIKAAEIDGFSLEKTTDSQMFTFFPFQMGLFSFRRKHVAT
jgi:hypothetical protein